MNDELLPLLEAAKRTGYSAANLRQQANRGTIPAAKLGRDWFVWVSDIPLLRERREKFKKHGRQKPLAQEDGITWSN